MPLKLWGLFCTAALVHASYFDCVMNATVWKVKAANMFVMLLIWCKIEKKKLLETTIPLRKWIWSKVYSHPVKNVWISSLTLIMIFWWTEPFWEAAEKFQNFIFNFKDIWKRQFVFYNTLIAFFHTGKLVSSRVFIETSYSDGFYMLHFLNFLRSRVIVQIEYGW